MPRPSRSDRLNQIAEAALAAFSNKGFRLTQVADIAKLAGVAPGTIYLFAESKEALFWLAFGKALDRPLEEISCEPPNLTQLREVISPNSANKKLNQFLAGATPEPPSLETVVEELWEAIDHAAPAIKLVERCAWDWPELADAFYKELRPGVVDSLAKYLTLGAEAGVCRPVPNPALAARLIIETIAWFAMHRRGDVDGRHIDSEAARETTIDALVHAYGTAQEAPCK